jgi:cytosine/adenosine deaminase-related metal-dependent hydrolase
VYHGHGKDVETVIVDGQVVVSNGHVQTADEDALITRASHAATAAWNRFTQRYGSFVAPAPN